MRRRTALLVAGLLVLAGCSDRELPLYPMATPASSDDVPSDTVGAPPQDGVGTFGEIVEIKPQGQGLVLYQTGLDDEEVEGTKINSSRHELAVGARHQQLQVQIRDSTEIWVKGKRVTVDSLTVGLNVLVVGRVTGAALHADQILDLTDAGPPPEDVSAIAPLAPLEPVASTFEAPPAVDAVSLCRGQRLPYTDADILAFQGCWGGPSASDFVNTGFIPIFCPIIGCLGVDQLRYQAALLGWSFAFPFRFEATTSETLVYHVPGDVALKITPLDAGDARSFIGGLGVEFGIRFRWCGIFGCYDLGTKYLSMFTTTQQTAGAAPLTGQTLDIKTTSCPSIALIPIEGFPLNPLELGICQDLDLAGRSFDANVTADGAESSWLGRLSFGPGAISRTVRPMGMGVDVGFDSFRWVPVLQQGYFFRLRSFTIKLFDTPEIPFPFLDGEWQAITTPFPSGVFTLATDPATSQPMAHPTSVTIGLEVDPAPTLLSFTSPVAVEDGQPVTAWLRENYLAAPIAGASVVIEATGLNGTPSVTAAVPTDGTGTASLLLPPGEYQLAAEYAGSETYLPSSAALGPVYVYRPTTFVIWGGNPGGVEVGERYQFWGTRWVRQVTGGEYGGNPSFQGFVVPQSELTWVSPPAASSPRMPDSVPDVISVIVTTRVVGRGSWATGDIAAHAILRVESPERYRPAAGHESWGVLRMHLP